MSATSATSASLVIHHPRQAFAEANLLPGRLGVPGAWSFDRMARDGAAARRNGGEVPGDLCQLRLPPASASERPLALGDVVAALVNPVRTFLQHGVGVRIPRPREERSDLVATKPDPLGAWGLASRLFELVLTSQLPVDGIEQQWRRLAAADGDLPPGRFAERAAASTRERIAALTEGLATSGLPLRAAGIEAIDLRLPSGRTLTDRVTDVHGTTVVLARPGRLRPKELLDAHVRVLALRAAGIDADGIIAGTTTKQPYDSVRVDIDVDATTAVAALDELVELALLCRAVAMPIAVNVAAAWAAGAFRAVPDTAWKEDLWDPSTQLVFGHLIAPDLGLHIPPGEHRTGFELATRLWGLLRGIVS
jgi:exodeoxyribonuclease V gamma subunit